MSYGKGTLPSPPMPQPNKTVFISREDAERTIAAAAERAALDALDDTAELPSLSSYELKASKRDDPPAALGPAAPRGRDPRQARPHPRPPAPRHQ